MKRKMRREPVQQQGRSAAQAMAAAERRDGCFGSLADAAIAGAESEAAGPP
jgi:hypothetical protein